MTGCFQHYADGKTLYGDDFSFEQIETWFREEAKAYYSLPEERAPGVYAYHARNWHHGFRHLPTSDFKHVLSLGGAYGDELQPILSRAKKVTILEPAGGFQNPRFEYVSPDISGRMPFADNTFDLITCFGVLHHIPNVSTVVREIARCSSPDGWQLICEPTHSMGNWDEPRRLLTAHERGIPANILRDIISDAGLHIIRERRCMFSLTSRLQFLFSKREFVFNKDWVTALDDFLSNLSFWSTIYHATRPIHKLRPWGMFLVLQKRNITVELADPYGPRKS